MIYMRHGTTIDWTVNANAHVNDLVVFYMIGPLSAFVAFGTIASDVWKEMRRGNEWYGHHFAIISNLQLLKMPVPLGTVRSAISEWSWLRQPRQSITVPNEFAPRFVALLKASVEIKNSDPSDWEGSKTEVFHFVSKRSRRLRDQAFADSRGICAVCERDFSKVLGGRGVRVLQVHHQKQLSVYRVPRKTRLSDLVVVCANCHMLIHIDSNKPISIEKMRKMLAW